MNRIYRSFWMGGLFLLIFWVAGIFSQALAMDFSADMISRVGQETMQSKIYVSEEKTRMEMPQMTTIIRHDKKVSWMLMPSEKMYMEHPIDPSKAPKTAKNFDGEMERTSLGVEAVDGVQAEKFKVIYKEGKKIESVYQWIKDGQIPVKVEAIDGSWSTEYKNISTATQPADLFEIPDGYTKMSMPSLGDLMGMGGN